MASIVWVEDQFHWIDKFKSILESTDFDEKSNQLFIYRSAQAACQSITEMKKSPQPDIAILDARMNGNDEAGFSVSRALLKKWPKLPVIYLSEHSGTGIEQEAFESSNAKDFIAKHQQNIEAVLCWRIKAILRQNAMQHTSPSDVIQSGNLSIDLLTWEVYWQGVKLMNPSNPQRPLAPTPRKILRYLVEASPRPLSTGQIAEKLEADPEKFSYANYRQHIKTLRKSFELSEGDNPTFPQHCKAGVGIVTFGDAGAYCWKPTR